MDVYVGTCRPGGFQLRAGHVWRAPCQPKVPQSRMPSRRVTEGWIPLLLEEAVVRHARYRACNSSVRTLRAFA